LVKPILREILTITARTVTGKFSSPKGHWNTISKREKVSARSANDQFRNYRKVIWKQNVIPTNRSNLQPLDKVANRVIAIKKRNVRNRAAAASRVEANKAVDANKAEANRVAVSRAPDDSPVA
jgi:prolyl oligopeptidase PreP (S9A serine peptidase family)